MEGNISYIVVSTKETNDIFFFSEKTGLDILHELSAWHTIHMKYEDLFLLKKKKKKLKMLSAIVL